MGGKALVAQYQLGRAVAVAVAWPVAVLGGPGSEPLEPPGSLTNRQQVEDRAAAAAFALDGEQELWPGPARVQATDAPVCPLGILEGQRAALHARSRNPEHQAGGAVILRVPPGHRRGQGQRDRSRPIGARRLVAGAAIHLVRLQPLGLAVPEGHALDRLRQGRLGGRLPGLTRIGGEVEGRDRRRVRPPADPAQIAQHEKAQNDPGGQRRGPCPTRKPGQTTTGNRGLPHREPQKKKVNVPTTFRRNSLLRKRGRWR